MKTKRSENIIELMQRRIDTGEWKPGEKIPSEPELAVIFGVSRSTIREALQEMSYRGQINRIHGVGSFVSQKSINYGINDLASISEIICANGYSLKIENILLDITKPSQREMELLKLQAMEAIFHVQRIYYANDNPVVFENAVYPYAVLQGVDESAFFGSMFHILEQRGHTVKFSDGWVRAISACGEPARALHVAENTPLLLVETVMTGTDDSIIGYVQDHYSEWFAFPIHRVRTTALPQDGTK